MRISYYKIIQTIIIVFILFSVNNTHSYGQVVVEKSKDKVIISGKSYYIHIVKKGETAYSIAKAYYITVDELVSENPVASRGLNIGQSLRLPIREMPVQNNLPSLSRDESKFIYHKLLQGETVYSLSRRYGVTESAILDSNPGVEIHQLPVGAEIAIPRVKEPVPAPRDVIVITEAANQAKEIAAVPQVPVDQGAGEVQQVPVQSGQQYIFHKVVKGESIASIAAKYGLTVRELRRENRGIMFPKVDDYIRIPVERITEIEQMEISTGDSIAVEVMADTKEDRATELTMIRGLSGRYNVALLLPLYLAENSKRSETDSSQVIKGKRVYKVINRPEQWIYPGTMPFLELYQGILLAADTLRSLGLDINLHVWDIRSDTVDLHRLIESGDLRNMDLIIGPVYSRNLAMVTEYAKRFDIPVISPVPLRSNEILIDNPNLFIVNPSLDIAQEAISSYVSGLDSCNVIFIHSDSVTVDEKIDYFRERILAGIGGADSTWARSQFNDFSFYSRSLIGKDYVGRLEKIMNDSLLNVILIASEEPAVMSELIMEIHTLSKKYRVKLIGYPAMRDIENLDPKFYFELGIELVSSYWIDYTDENVSRYLSRYRSRFLTEPSENSFAWLGYDIMYYFMSGISMHGRRFIARPWIHNPALLETEFMFSQPSREDGFENHNLFLIRYNSKMELELLKNSKDIVNKN